MSKWRKVDPDQIKVGDRVKVKHVSDDYEETTSADVKHVTDLEIGIGPYTLHKNEGAWYIRKEPKLSPTERAQFALTMPTISEPYSPPEFPPAGFAPDATNASDDASDDAPRFPEPFDVGTVVAVEFDNPSGFTTTWTKLRSGQWAGYPSGDCVEVLNWKPGVEEGVIIGARSVEVLWPKPTPPTRPDEPPVGSLFRVDRTDGVYQRFCDDGSFDYFTVGDLSGDIVDWREITEPGDTITMLKLVEDKPPATVHYPRPYGEDTQ